VSKCSDKKGAGNAAKGKPASPVKETKKECPPIELAEMVEVVTRGAAEAPVTGIAPSPASKTPLQGGNAAIVRPAAAPGRQYINLPKGVDGAGKEQPHYERYIQLRARVKWKGGGSGSLAGKTVHFAFTPTYGSDRPAQLYPGGVEGFTTGEKATAATDTDGWTPVVNFLVSMYGGDKFKISAQADEDGKGTLGPKKETGDYEVWRKIFYSLDCMNRPDGSDYSDRVTEATLISEYKKSFLELERVGALDNPAHALLVEKDTSNVWAAAELPAQAARTLNFGLIDTLAKGAPIPFTLETDATGESFAWSLSGGSYAFDLSAQNKWLTSAKYYDKNLAVGARVLTDLPFNKVTLALDGLDYKLAVDVAGVVAGGLALNRIHVVLDLKKRDFLSGMSWGPITLVGMRWREKEYPGQEGDAAMHTMFHESGHFLGVAPKKIPDSAKSDNPYYYDEAALGVGVGPHCSYDKENPATAADLPATPKCIMYHEFRVTMSFCTNCSVSLRARNLMNPAVSGKADF
jgi:hypothetical protein